MDKLIKEILSSSNAGVDVKVSGWVRTRRESKEFSFLEINDGSTLSGLQVIAPTTLPNYTDDVARITTGSSVTVEGKLVESPGKGQRYEVQATKISIHGLAPKDYPLQKKRHSFEFLREIAHLRPRTNSIGAVARVRSSLSNAVHSFFTQNGFVYVHTPIITTSDCEGAGSMFRVSTLDPDNPPRKEDGAVDYTKDFFGRQASLTVSGQLEGEAYALALSRIYTFGPTFRAENSNTARHLAEFWMIEPEMAFCRLMQNMDVAEEFVRYLAQYALEHNGEDLQFFNDRIDKSVIATLENIKAQPFERLSYSEAVKILKSNDSKFQYPVSWGADLQSEHERFLTEEVFSKPVIVYDYPKEIKAFYMRLNDDNETVGAMDLLVPRIGELIGGSEREERHEVLSSRMRQSGLNEEEYRWYLDLRRFGSTPHAGFGLGFERLLLLVTGMQNIREVIPFPRFPGNAQF
ncbi:asparagine--tRNA ligase [Chitinispirillales bacterium ANBcel5]|uniref:asparagine--tRNA ligase n=1 Tax=Cellulosispirillum alkaliphilum TaxID=3039283 RepID=UPI002A514F96|nr:asparagine--tRNA ligase [Chitinispirillales bacterium ANBcel5]